MLFKIENGKKEERKVEKKEEIRGIFVSYIDYKNKFKNDDLSKQEIDKMISNVEKEKFNLIILQVRSFSDALYESEIFPKAKEVNCSFDVLDYFIKIAHQKNILVYAWVNPYRISTNPDLTKIDSTNPAYKWINTDNIKSIPEKGVFYNPAKDEVKDLIIKGIKEIVSSYNVDGVCIDDYFYPCQDIDKDDYEEYLKTHPGLTLEDFHIKNVNDLISKTYQEIKNLKQSVLFGISPDGNIDNNYTTHGADVKTWVTKKGYLDFIMPQVYYGFKNENKPYIDTVKTWNDLIKINNIELIPALALYKAGSIDPYAQAGKEEWIEESNILQKQVLIGRNLNHYKGFALFRYDYMFNETSKTEQLIKEVENLKKIID